MRVLFVTSELFNKTGGGMLTRTYLDVLNQVSCIDEVHVFAFPKRDVIEEISFNGYVTSKKYSFFEKICNVLIRTDPSIGKEVEKELIAYLYNHEIDIIFIFRSCQAELIRVIKQNNICLPIVAFYHDIFPEVYKDRKRNLKEFLLRYPIYVQYLKMEKYCSKVADANIVLNNRERINFIKYYNKEPDSVICTVWKDMLNREESTQYITQSNKFTLCFVGSYFAPNVNGIRWFAKNVMPFLSQDIHLQIVGNKMEKLKSEEVFKKPNIDIVGTVDLIAPYYYNSDVIIAPIFEGTGMKSKTAEALMFGKVILATPEALCGYEKSLNKYCCETASDFINKIEHFYVARPSKFNKEMRQIYDNNHSISAACKKIEVLFLSLLK